MNVSIDQILLTFSDYESDLKQLYNQHVKEFVSYCLFS